MAAVSDDREQLDLLSIFHWVLAAIVALFSLFPSIHLAMGLAIVSGELQPNRGSESFPFEAMGWFIVVFAALFIVLGFTFAVALAQSGRYLKARRRRKFCLVVAGISCAFVPLGTVLGVFTIIVLNRDSVRASFAASPPAGATLS